MFSNLSIRFVSRGHPEPTIYWKKDKVQIAFEMLEHVYVSLNNDKMCKSNKHHLGHPDRVEHDLTELEKEHLALLRSKVTMEISEKINRTLLESSESHGGKMSIDSVAKMKKELHIVCQTSTSVKYVGN